MVQPVVIGIAGGSGSGKTTVLRCIVEAFGSAYIAVLDHDAYYHSLEHLPPEQRARVNFDHPDSLDTALMRRHLDELIAGRPIEKPLYNFTTHVREPLTEHIEPRPVIIVEGILVLAELLLVERMDIKIFVDIEADVRLIRRIRRDMQERGRTIDSILDQYENTVRPMHLEFVEPSKRRADVIIPRGGHNNVAIDMVIARIGTLLKKVRIEAPV